MIGSGIFVSPGGVLKRTGSVGVSLLVWAGCGIVSSLGKNANPMISFAHSIAFFFLKFYSVSGAICYIELGCLIPQSGAETVYLKEKFTILVSKLLPKTITKKFPIGCLT